MTKIVIQAAWDDAPHLDEGAKEALSASYRPHERDARMRGLPTLGSGRIYVTHERDFTCEPFQLPNWFRRVYALDVGWNRTAALWGAIDPDEDVLYLYSEYYMAEAQPAVHAQALRSRGTWIPGVIDPASRGRSVNDGAKLLEIYAELGLSLSTANNVVEAGIYEVQTRLSSGRLRAFNTLENFFSEYRIYRRDDKGKPVKENDHLMDALRYLVVSGVPGSAQMPIEKVGAARAGSQHQFEYDPFAYGNR